MILFIEKKLINLKKIKTDADVSPSLKFLNFVGTA